MNTAIIILTLDGKNKNSLHKKGFDTWLIKVFQLKT